MVVSALPSCLVLSWFACITEGVSESRRTFGGKVDALVCSVIEVQSRIVQKNVRPPNPVPIVRMWSMKPGNISRG